MSIVRLKLLDKMFFWIIIYSLPLFGWNHSAISDDTKRQFVADKWVLAVQEMHKSGIPASVTLAQCILELFWYKMQRLLGRSYLLQSGRR